MPMFDLHRILIVFPLIVICLTVHEYAHALAADRLGDSTPRAAGRLTLNPLAHLDPIGILPILFGIFIGWAKPVPINPSYFRNPRRDEMIVSAAGPGANLLLGLIAGIVLRIIIGTGSVAHAPCQIVSSFIVINISLAVFNLIPVFPLDGSHILLGFLNDGGRRIYWRYFRNGSWVLLVILFLDFYTPIKILSGIISPLVYVIFYFFTGVLH